MMRNGRRLQQPTYRSFDGYRIILSIIDDDLDFPGPFPLWATKFDDPIVRGALLATKPLRRPAVCGLVKRGRADTRPVLEPRLADDPDVVQPLAAQVGDRDREAQHREIGEPPDVRRFLAREERKYPHGDERENDDRAGMAESSKPR